MITTLGEFVTNVEGIIAAQAGKPALPLEAYLRGLWGLIQQHQTDIPSFDLFAQLLKDAFSAEPLPFDDHWLDYVYPPRIADGGSNAEHFVQLQQLILFQIADLRRMKEIGVLEKPAAELYFGVISPTKNSWYNFWPESFLECGIRGITDDADNELDKPITPGWDDLAVLLHLGQIYE